MSAFDFAAIATLFPAHGAGMGGNGFLLFAMTFDGPRDLAAFTQMLCHSLGWNTMRHQRFAASAPWFQVSNRDRGILAFGAERFGVMVFGLHRLLRLRVAQERGGSASRGTLALGQDCVCLRRHKAKGNDNSSATDETAKRD